MKKNIFKVILLVAVFCISTVCFAQAVTAAPAATVSPILAFLGSMVGFGTFIKAFFNIHIAGKDIIEYIPESWKPAFVDASSIIIYAAYSIIFGHETWAQAQADFHNIALQGLANSSTAGLIHDTCPWLNALVDKVQGAKS